MNLRKWMTRKNFGIAAVLLVLYIVISALAFRYTTCTWGYNNYRSTLWADKSGYYVYLPAAFIYGFEAEAYPNDIEATTGSGFIADKNQNKILTKYTWGLALLILPFFLFTHLYALATGQADGFGPVYQEMLNLTGPFYAVLGLFLLYRFLRYYVRPIPALITCTLIFTGTNVYYYATGDAFMSHIYSFFLFALSLYATRKYTDKGYSFKWAIVLIFSVLMIVLIRPTDFLFVLFLPFLNFRGWKPVGEFLHSFLSLKKIAAVIVLFILIFGPQMAYWKFAHDSFLTYSYGNEGFDNLTSPKIAEVLFSTMNGLLLYNPFYLLLFVTMFILVYKDRRTGLPVLLLIVSALYLISSWYCWFYGCSYGMRPMVQYTAILALPFAIFIDRKSSWLFSRYAIVVLGFVLTYFSMRLVYVYEHCYYGSTWDFYTYSKYLERMGMGDFSTRSFRWEDDYENDILSHASPGRARMQSDNAWSGNWVTFSTNTTAFTSGFDQEFSAIVSETPKSALISVYTSIESGDSAAHVVCEISRNDSCIFWHSAPLVFAKKPKWEETVFEFNLPPVQLTDRMKVYVWTPGGTIAYADNLNIKLIY